MSALVKLVTSTGWKKVTSHMYGFGAALVIIGALFKLQHWPGAGYMLSVGMITECVIFFFSAFEPIPTEYHWEAVYPQLLHDDGHAQPVPMRAAQGMGMSGGVDLSIDSNEAEKLKQNVERFNQSVGSLGVLATISDTSNKFVNGLQQAAGNMNVLNESAQVFATAYRETAQTMTAGGQQANANLTTLNKNLQAVNTSYELYLQEHNSYLEHSKKMISTMDNSAQQAQQFDQQMIALNKQITELNTVYTSIVNTVNASLKKR